MDPFEALGIKPPRLTLSALDLERDYHCLSLLYHPDHNKGEEAVAKTSLLNSAYRLLRDPWLRAETFLKLNAGILKSANKSYDISSLANTYFEIQESEDREVLGNFASELQMRLSRLESERDSLFMAIDSQLEGSGESTKNKALLLAGLKDLSDFRRSLESMLRDCRDRMTALG